MSKIREVIGLPCVELEWSEWVPWEKLKTDARKGGIPVPNKKPGVYEVRRQDEARRLHIGKAADLRRRIKQHMLKGQNHSAGERILAGENTHHLLIRWAVTDRPAAVEEELHKRHESMFGRLPEYDHHT